MDEYLGLERYVGSMSVVSYVLHVVVYINILFLVIYLITRVTIKRADRHVELQEMYKEEILRKTD